MLESSFCLNLKKVLDIIRGEMDQAIRRKKATNKAASQQLRATGNNGTNGTCSILHWGSQIPCPALGGVRSNFPEFFSAIFFSSTCSPLHSPIHNLHPSHQLPTEA
jgi:hypothetical protein